MGRTAFDTLELRFASSAGVGIRARCTDESLTAPPEVPSAPPEVPRAPFGGGFEALRKGHSIVFNGCSN
jgi:hypothetical protein